MLTEPRIPSRPAARIRPALRGFVRAEDGHMTIFSVLMTVLMLTITGAAVDIMRQEAVRADMQGTMDRAVLAAADLEQQQDPAAVVTDYLAKSGMAATLESITVDEGLNYRVVTAEGGADLTTYFLRMSGYPVLATPTRAVAQEKVQNVEISLVLDVSGSMGGSRITNMRNAAQEFVDTVIQPDGAPGMTTVSVVPYNATVNIGQTLSPYFNLSEEHDYSHCAVFPDADFDSVALDPAAPLDRKSHFEMFNSDQSGTGIDNPWCPTGDRSRIVVHGGDVGTLQSAIGALNAGGNTAIDVGMKWGVALLDPAMRPLVSALVQDGLAPAGAAARPAAYDDREALKFVVVMTDGQNTGQYDLAPEFRSGLSDIWVNDRGTSWRGDDRYSLRVRDRSGTDNDVFFWERREHRGWNDRYRNRPDGGWDNARQMTWAEAFDRFPMRGLAWRMYTQPYYDGWVSYNDWYDVYDGYSVIAGNRTANNRLSRICRAARDEGIVVFAIGFEAPRDGQAAMRDCASSASHYFNVSGVDITETFHAIARQINSLRLTE